MLVGQVHHYLFGELQQVNESRGVPETATALRGWLDSWLRQWVESAEEAEPNFEQVRDRCRDWQTGDRRDEVGVISLPLAGAPSLDGVRYAHLICRVYFNWASGGRVSRTGHAVVLTAAQWQALDYNPFRLPHLVENAAAFLYQPTLPFEGFGARERQANQGYPGGSEAQFPQAWRSHLAEIWRGAPPVRLPADTPLQVYALLLLSLPPERRAQASCVCGPFGLKRDFQEAIDVARGAGLSVSGLDPAKAGLCLDRLDQGKLIDGCWDIPWESKPLGIPGPPVAVPPSPPAARQPSVIIDHAAQPKGSRPQLRLVLGLALAIAVGLWFGPQTWRQSQLKAECAASVQDFADSQKRRNDMRELLGRAEALLEKDPDELVCADQKKRVRALIELYGSRLAEVENPCPSGKAA